MTLHKIKKYNLDNELLKYLRNVDSKITYDDLDSEVKKDIKNMLPSSANQTIAKYDDSELRSRIINLENDKQDVSSALTKQDIVDEINESKSLLTNAIKTEMLNYIKNENGVISESLLSNELKSKINARYNSNRAYSVSYIGGGSGGSGSVDLTAVTSRLDTLETKVFNNEIDIINNNNNISSNTENIRLANIKIDQSEINTYNKIKEETNKSFSDLETNISSISQKASENGNKIKVIEDSLVSLGKNLESNYIMSNSKIEFSQLDAEIQNALQRARYTNVKITMSDLDEGVISSIQTGSNFDIREFFTGSTGQTYFTKKYGDQVITLEPDFIFAQNAIVTKDSSKINEYKEICKNYNNIVFIYDLTSKTIYHDLGDENGWETIDGDPTEILAGRFFILEPDKSLCFYDTTFGCIEIINISGKVDKSVADSTYATISDFDELSTNMSTSVSTIDTEIDIINSNINAANSNISTNYQKIQQLEDKIKTLEDKIKTFENKISALEQAIPKE